MSRNNETLTVEIVEPQATFTLREICERGDCHAELVLKMVSYGIIEPVGALTQEQDRQWEFDLAALLRLQKAMRLQRDLKMNLPGLAMSLELLDEVETMRREIGRLRQQLGQLSPDQDSD
ncbi:chaperone modulator CbpM [Marinobacter sp. M216]|uniref:Chaperone modulator CbpM n=1 Tax=Marinobacter albus TaxID=3030833 RepID=A0ABT7HBB5_9GAMM|nr:MULTISPECIES: chaperone modulator CbpM [unclassified Marinobacter]MBW7470925.1 chaperone modulator CbpM [Marinobacter sp. F4218]MDK9556795.1 chaperone modulator CbpM [Marinobacter sp. M216]